MRAPGLRFSLNYFNCESESARSSLSAWTLPLWDRDSLESFASKESARNLTSCFREAQRDEGNKNLVLDDVFSQPSPRGPETRKLLLDSASARSFETNYYSQANGCFSRIEISDASLIIVLSRSLFRFKMSSKLNNTNSNDPSYPWEYGTLYQGIFIRVRSFISPVRRQCASDQFNVAFKLLHDSIECSNNILREIVRSGL